MKLSDFKDERAIDVLADILEPAAEIVANPANAEVAASANDGFVGKLKFAKAMLKNSRNAVMDILAILNDTPRSEYHCNAATVIKDLVDILSDEELLSVFGLQQKKKDGESSGAAAENTTDAAE